MFTEQQIIAVFTAAKELKESELGDKMQEMIQKQNTVISFILANVKEYKLEKDTEFATIELALYLFELYKSSGFDKALEKNVLADAIENVNKASADIEKGLGGLSKEDVEILNAAISTGQTSTLSGKLKEILEAIVEKKNSVSQPILLEYISNYISSDKMMKDKDHSYVFSLMEILIEAIQLQAKASLKS